jgi:hypothetical protein
MVVGRGAPDKSGRETLSYRTANSTTSGGTGSIFRTLPRQLSQGKGAARQRFFECLGEYSLTPCDARLFNRSPPYETIATPPMLIRQIRQSKESKQNAEQPCQSLPMNPPSIMLAGLI